MSSRVEVMLKLTGHVEKTIAELAINCHAELVEATPVDTGFARAVWTPNLGEPTTLADPAAAQAGLEALLAYKLANGSIFISNNAKYIQRLDEGSSDQAPAGFVRQAIAKGILETGSGRLA